MTNILSTGTINGTGSADIIMDNQGGNSTINGFGGNDVIIADHDAAWLDNSNANSTFGTATNIDNSAYWSRLANPDVGNTSVPYTTILGTGAGAFDYFAVTIGAGQTITLDIDYGQGSLGGAGFDSELRLFNSAFGQVATNDDSSISSGGLGSTSIRDSYLTYTAASAGTYYIRVERFNDTTLNVGDNYMLNVSVTGHANTNSASFGSDLVNAGSGDDVVYGLDGGDTLNGDSGNDTILGGLGDDVIQGGSGADSMSGEGGRDTLSYATSSSAVTVALNGAVSGGDATGDTINGFESLIGSNFNDSLNGNSVSNAVVDGGAGNDTITGGFATQSLLGGTGNDLFVVGAGQYLDNIAGGSGIDTLDHSALSAADVGGDIFDFESGVITTGFAASPTLSAIDIEVYLDGAGGNEIRDRAGAFTINAGAGDDTVIESTSGGTDSFDLGLGNDYLVIQNTGIGGDVFNGGGGDDTIAFTTITMPAGTVISLRDGMISLGGSMEALLNFENVFGSLAGETIIGTHAHANHLVGNAGNDTILGLDGDDLINGGANNDNLRGGLGNDTIIGGTGDDTMNAHGGDDSLVGGDGNDVVSGQFGLDTINSGSGNDTIQGGGSNDQINAGSGNDFANGGAGADTLLGSTGHDTLRGGAQADSLEGGNGNDSLIGDVGNDYMSGEAGADTLNGGGNADSLYGGTGNDLLRGQDGFDFLDGGVGNDTLTGGIQGDDFAFAAGYDVDLVTDFANNSDELYLDDNLWGGGLTAQQVVNAFASVVGGNTIFNFGGGDVLQVDGIGNAQLLVDDIVIV